MMKDEEKRIFIKIHNELINALSTVEDEMRAAVSILSPKAKFENPTVNVIKKSFNFTEHTLLSWE